MPVNPGGIRPLTGRQAQKVVRLANAEWMAQGLNTGERYSLQGWDIFENAYMVFDNVNHSLFRVNLLLAGLSRSRREAFSRS